MVGNTYSMTLKEGDWVVPVGDELVPDCTVQNVTFAPSPLDDVLLWVFRRKVQEEISPIRSPTKGILGLLDEARMYMLSAEGYGTIQSRFLPSSIPSRSITND